VRIIYASILLSAVFFTAIAQSSRSFGQTENPNPPFALTISVNPSNPSHENTANKTVTAGESVTIRIRKTNTSDHEIPKLGPDNGPFGYVFDIRDSNGNLAPPHKSTSESIRGGGPAPIFGTKDMVLQPGKSKIDYAPVSEWFDMTKPGTYTIQVSQHVSSDPNSAVVKSNKVTVTIQP